MYKNINGLKKEIGTTRAFLSTGNLSLINSHNSSAQGAGRGKDLMESLKKSIGENYEREELYSLNATKNKIKVACFYNDILKIKNKNQFHLLYSVTQDIFKDSSGNAAGENSFMAVNNAYLEFVERQSLVYSFVTKRAGLNLLELINKDDGKYKILSTKTAYVNDISIVPWVSVIIIVIFTNEGYAIGLGTDYDQKTAFKKSFDEVFGYQNELFKNNEEINSNFDEFLNQNLDDGDIYLSYFSKNVNSYYLKKTYDFLSNGLKAKFFKKRKHQNYIEISKLSNFLKIPINVEFLRSDLGNNTLKRVRIYSDEAYPTINNSRIEPENYKISYFESDIPEFKNRLNYLPFP